VALAILFFAILAKPETAHAHSVLAFAVSTDKAAPLSDRNEGVWKLGHCDDGPTCSAAKSILHVDYQPARDYVSCMNFDLKLSAYRSTVLGRDPPVAISIL